MNGALLVDKPIGPTSHDVVARARRALGERSIGHTGTLDPLATGLLLLLTGRATRLASLMTGAHKTYEATVRLGFSTNTFDAAGERQAIEHGIAPAAIDDAAVDEVIESMRQQRSQMPPAFSAKQVGGVRAYTLARRNEVPVLKAVDVCVYAMDWRRAEPDVLHITLTCSAGYYVRAMAQEIGERLRCGAHLEALRRTRVGAFDVGAAVPLDVLERDEREAAAARLLPMEALLPDVPAVTLTGTGVTRASHGNLIEMACPGEAARYRLLAPDGRLVAIAEASPAGLKPFIVLAAAG
ncbi:MAG: tRNA pseudouridine(55) synthase TruB [Acidobacteria bacterium]|nr:tRNA pseudouridine(55) synthase TruB [Acidobacteriota bacterium]